MTIISDTYNYTQSPLGGGIYATVSDKGLQSTSTGADGAAGAVRDNVSCYLASVYQFLPTHFSEITIGNTADANDWPGAAVCCSPTGGIKGGGQAYLAYYIPEAGTATLYLLSQNTINQVTDGSFILTVAASFAAGDKLKLGITRATNTLTMFKNGVSIGSVVDATYTGGQPGLAYEIGNNNGTKISAWTGSDAFVAITTILMGGMCL